MITRTRSVYGGTPATGIVESGAIRRVESDALQGSLVAQVVGHVDVGTCSNRKISKEKKSIENKKTTHVGRKKGNLFISKN